MLGIDPSAFVILELDPAISHTHSYSRRIETTQNGRRKSKRQKSSSSRKAKDSAMANRWNNSSSDTCCSVLSCLRPLSSNLGPYAAFRIHALRRPSLETMTADSLSPKAKDPPRCPVRRESIDIDELAGIDISSILSLNDSQISHASDDSLSELNMDIYNRQGPSSTSVNDGQ